MKYGQVIALVMKTGSVFFKNDACWVDAIQLVADYRARIPDREFVCMPFGGEYGIEW